MKIKKLLFLSYLTLLTTVLWAQKMEHLSPDMVKDFKANYHSKVAIEPQRILYADAYFLRFPELGKIYNPLFPKTRNKVHCSTFQQQGNALEYIGYSVSTFRATVQLKGRVGTFYAVWRGESCSSLIEYQVTRDGEYLDITGTIYKCFSST